MNKKLRTPLVYLAILVLAILLASEFNPSGSKPQELTYTELLSAIKEDRVKAVDVTDNQLLGLYTDTKISDEQFPKQADFKVIIPSNDIFKDDVARVVAAKNPGVDPATVSIEDFGFDTNFNPTPAPSFLEVWLPYIITFALLGGLLYYMYAQQQGGKMSNFGKSRARTHLDQHKKVTFADVAGADEEKEELQEIVDFMRNPKRFSEIGARIPKGVLLVGPPGCGKTLLAKACAGEANVPFFSISGSDFVEMFVGVGASRVRDLFNTAKRSTPAIIFIDEIDAVGRQRGAGLGGGHDEREQTLNQLLVEMDGFAPNEGIIVIAATNRPDILDPALLRPGRFDRRIVVNYPDAKGREEVLKVHASNKAFEEDVDLSIIAKRTPGFTGADLENVLNEAAILTARAHKKKIGSKEIEEAVTRVMMGPEKKSRVISEEDKKLTAYHEAGHAIVAQSLPNCDPVHEVSIIPRGMAGGYTMMLPKDDKVYRKKQKLLDEIAMSMGGRVAEEAYLDDISTGAHGDLQHATELARKMVVDYGMSDNIGPVFLGGEAEVFIARDWGHQRNYSEEVAAKVDLEIKKILSEQYQRAKEIVTRDPVAMERVVEALLKHERITGDEFRAVYNGDSIEIVGIHFDGPGSKKHQSADDQQEQEEFSSDFSGLDEFHLDRQND